MRVEDINEDEISSVLKRIRFVSSFSDHEIKQFKRQFYTYKIAYDNFIYDREFYSLDKKEQDRILKRVRSVSLMYSKLCVEWDKRSVTNYMREKRELLCAL